MKIGVIGAMEIEVLRIRGLLEDVSSEQVSGQDFYSGTLCGHEVVVARSGEGKVNAAACTQTMILKYSPDVIINTGVAGGIDKGVKVKDVVIAENVVQHDMDMSFLGFDIGYVMGVNAVKIPCDKTVTDNLIKASNVLGITSVHTGTVASGDQFIHTKEQRERIFNNFSAMCAEMEGGSIGHVCAVNGVPFGVVRAISDGADSDSHIDFNVFKEIAADISEKLVEEFIKLCK